MINRGYLFLILFFSAILLALHLLAISDFWYWKYIWFDNVMHFWGGMTIGLIAITYSERFNLLKGATIWKFVGNSLVGVFIAALLWEIFEYWAGITFSIQDPIFYSILDTIKDVLVGLLGAFIAALIGWKLSKYEPN